MKPESSSSIFLIITVLFLGGVVRQCGAQVGFQLNGFSSNPDVTYDSSGLPLTVPILFNSDIEIDQASAGAVGTAWVVWSLSESSGDNLYSTVSDSTNDVSFDSTAAGTQDGVITFSLPRTSNEPGIDTYVFSITAELMYQNTASLAVLMNERTYDVTVQRQGEGVNNHQLDTGSGGTTTNTLTSPTVTKSSPLVSVASPATGLGLEGSGGPFSSPSPIVLVAGSSESNYRVWFTDMASVKVYSDSNMNTLEYEWPSSLVESSATSEDTADVTITLHSVPEAIYDLGTIYVALNVNFRDIQGDRRYLQGTFGNRTHSSEQQQVQEASVIAKIEMLPMHDESSGTGTGSVVHSFFIKMANVVGGVIIVWFL